MPIIRISINDQFGLYEENCKRLDLILKALNLKQLSEWKQCKDTEQGVLSGAAAITKAKEFESTVNLETLKLILSGSQYIDLRNHYGKEFHLKVADIDVWIRKSLFKLITFWDKISKEETCKKLGLNINEFNSISIRKYEEYFNSLPSELQNNIKKVEAEILEKRGFRQN